MQSEKRAYEKAFKIEAHREEYAVSTMCRVLDVSISGYYAWTKRPPRARQREDGELTQRLVHAFHRHHGVYGSPRLMAELRAEGIACGRRRVMCLMRQAHLCVCPHSKRRGTTHPDATLEDEPPPVCSIVSLVHRLPTKSGRQTSPRSRRGKAGCI